MDNLKIRPRRFFDWLKKNSSCILSVAGPYGILFAHDRTHWELVDGGENDQIFEVLLGEHPIGSLKIPRLGFRSVKMTEDEGEFFFRPHDKINNGINWQVIMNRAYEWSEGETLEASFAEHVLAKMYEFEH